MKGLVLKSTGSWYEVLGDNGVVHNARIRGKIRLEGIKETNPVAVGDYVTIESVNNESIITQILPRENYIARKSVKKTGHSHIIAANVDQALLIVSIAFPETSLGFIDRFMVAAESFRIPQVIVFNKHDLLDSNGRAHTDELVAFYRSLGVTCFSMSALNDDAEPVRKILIGKKTLFSGHSGVGKSTLINKLSPVIGQKTSDVSGSTQKGVHTTTFAEMFALDDSTYIIDTPGIKELGLVDIEPWEVSDYFIEMRELRLACKFGSKCLHLNEPKCAVKNGVENGTIRPSRYQSYVSITTGADTRA
jgi:ribosome biogenesis GTPase